MKRMLWLVTVLGLALVFYLPACDNGDGDSDAECESATDCDDGDSCTTDTCEDGECVFAPVTCDDDDPCTNDTCDPTSGECVFEPKDCSDENACTEDSCDPATGECLNGEPPDCNDDNICTLDMCDIETGECGHEPDDGAACDDGDPATFGDTCLDGMCLGTDRTHFQIDSLAYLEPAITFLGEDVTDLLSQEIDAELDDPTFAFVAIFDGPWSADGGGSFTFGDGVCEAGDPTLCGISEDGAAAAFDDVVVKTEGECGDDSTVAAPCFVTESKAFDVSAILPNKFEAGLPEIEGYAMGQFAADGGIVDGLVVGFLPLVVAEGYQLTLDATGEPVSVADFVADVPTETYEGVEGWWVHVGFTAAHVEPMP